MKNSCIIDDSSPPDFHFLPVSDCESFFKTNVQVGLTTDEAKKRLIENGPNLIALEAPTSLFQIIVTNIINPMNFIIGVATIFSGIVKDLPQVGVLIFVMVTNSTIGIIQEYKSEDTMNSVKN